MFVYLSKKIAIPNGVHLRCASWNATQVRSWTTYRPTVTFPSAGSPSDRARLTLAGLDRVRRGRRHAQGAQDGERDGEWRAAGREPLHEPDPGGHKGSVVVADWNPRHDKLTTSDQNGLIIVWMLHKGMWYEEMINNRNKSVVVDMRWSADGEKICIAYEDGHVIVGGAGGKRLWEKTCRSLWRCASGRRTAGSCCSAPRAARCWCTTRTATQCSRRTRASPTKASAHPRSSPSTGTRARRAIVSAAARSRVAFRSAALALCFANGNVQLMRGARDDAPLVVRTGLQKPSHAR